MRENIGLYRGKRIDNHEWVKGYLVTVAIDGKRFCLILVPCEGVIQLDGRSLRLALDAIENGRKIAGISDINGNSYFVDPETVGEYTGLTDKNGNAAAGSGDGIKKQRPDDGPLRSKRYSNLKCSIYSGLSNTLPIISITAFDNVWNA